VIKRHWHKRHIEEAILKGLMLLSFLVVAGALVLILGTVLVKGLPALNWRVIA